MEGKESRRTTGGTPRTTLWLTLGLIGACAAALALPAAASAATADPADLVLTKSDSPDPVREGRVLTYTITVENQGPDAATNVTVTDVLPTGQKGVDFVSATPNSCQKTGHTVTCDLGTLANGETATVTIKVRPRSAGQLSNTASVSSSTPDSVSANNSDTETTTVTQAPSGAQPKCAGQTATMVGTPGDDTLIGTPGRDVIKARGGDDVVRARGGRDLVCAGRGGDLVTGGRRADTVRGGAGGDTLRGNRGGDTLRGGRGRDHLFGGFGADLLVGGRGFDHCSGGPGGDVRRSCEA
jgi:uncharacterized repeat protein (TIGR01451 family)